MSSLWSYVLTLVSVLTLAGTQSATYDLSCLPDSGVSTLTACNSLYSRLSYCAGSDVAADAPFIDCYCNQQLYNGFYDCENEQRVCKRNDNFDSLMQTLIDQWNTECADVITFTPTTPPITSLTSTRDSQACESAAAACASATNILEQCSGSAASDQSQFSSCTCQSGLIAAEYSCLFLGNASCFTRPAVLTKLPVYSECVDQRSILLEIASTSETSGVAPASRSATTTITPITNTPEVSSKPVLPTSMQATATGSAGRIMLDHDIQVFVAVGIWTALISAAYPL